jgi:hypothetical protein
MPNWKKILVSGSDASLNSLVVSNGITGSLLGTASFAISSSRAVTASYALNGGVTQLLAGANITLSPTTGLGQVTISSTSGAGGFNTATGSYGSFYSTVTQTNVAGTARSMSLNTTDISNGVSISGSTDPFNTYIKTENAGVYDIQFSAQVDKTDSGTDEIWIWLRKNGTNLTDTATSIQLVGNGAHYVAAWNFFVNAAANDYYQLMWYSPDGNVRLHAEPAFGVVPGIPSLIVTANRIDQFLSNTGSFTGSFTGVLIGTASYASQALSSSFATSALSSSFATTAISASFATSASFAVSSSRAISSSFASTASFVNTLNQDVIVTGSLRVGSVFTGGTFALRANNFLFGSDTVAMGSNQWRTTAGSSMGVSYIVGGNLVAGFTVISNGRLEWGGNGGYIFYEGGNERLRMISGTGVLFNNISADYSLTYKGTTNANLFRINAGTNNVGIGVASPNASAIFDVVSTTQGLGLPSMTTTQKNAISTPRTGLQVYDSTLGTPEFYNGSVWTGGWNKRGNAGTDAANDFIGTTDGVDVMFRRGNVRAGFLNSSLNNTSFGVSSMPTNVVGNGNAAFGSNSSPALTSGSGNSSFGFFALYNNTTGGSNSAFGNGAMASNVSSSENAAFGFQSLYSSTAPRNTALGYRSAFGVTTGVNNVGVGWGALQGISTTSNNTAVGAESAVLARTSQNNSYFGNGAGYAHIAGDNSVYAGSQAGFRSSGSDNVGIGRFAGGTQVNQVSGDQNVFLGSLAASDYRMIAANKNVLIGYNAQTATFSGSNQLNLANVLWGSDCTGTGNTAAGSLSVGTNAPNASAIFDIVSTTKGLGLPSMTTTQQNAILSPRAGLLIYNSTLTYPTYYNGSSWNAFFNNTGSFTGSFTGSLLGTASFATSALSSSFATTSISSSFAITASFVGNSIVTASVSSNTITFTKGNGTTFPITVATGSGAGGSAFPFTGSATITGSLTVTGSVTSTGGYTGSLLGTASWATNVVNNGVTSVATAGTVSGITLTGGTITSTGTITLGGSISGLTNANLSGTAGITNANLANSAITVGSTGISLGGTATTLAGLTSVTSTAFTGSLLGTASFASSVH